MIVVCGNCKAKLKLDLPPEAEGKPIRFKCAKCGQMNQVSLSTAEASVKPVEPKQPAEPAPAPKPMQEPKPVVPGWLVVHDENAPVQTFELKPGKNTVGRISQQKPSDIMIETNDTFMSRCHFTLEVIPAPKGRFDFILSDNKSANGTFLNADKNKRLSETDQWYIKDGDTIQAGRTKIVLKTGESSGDRMQAEKKVKQTDYSKTIIL